MLIALDPGVTTGIATVDSSMESIHTDQIKVTHRELYGYLSDFRPDEIVYESFLYRRRDKVVLYPVEVIGVINLYAQTYDIPLYVQSPSQAKAFMPKHKLEALGLWVAGQTHAMDALRHLLYHKIITKGETRWLDKLRPV